MEILIGFIAGVVTLELILFLVRIFTDDEYLIVDIGTGLIEIPLQVTYKLILNTISAILAFYYVPCKLYDTYEYVNSKHEIEKFTAICHNTFVRIPIKDLDKFYWRCENESFIEPHFYIKLRDGYAKRKISLKNTISLKEYQEMNVNSDAPLEKFMISNQK